jgi:pimeloyl-ACP methyl ester carboxylesterase
MKERSIKSRPLPGRISPAEMFPAKDPRFHSRFVTLRSGARVRVAEAGDAGAPPVLLIPGWACSVYVYRFLLPALADAGYRAISFDVQGHGLSDKPTDPAAYTGEALTRHVLEVLDALSLERVILGGHSMGAMLAARVAIAAPHRVNALVLLAPVGVTAFRGIHVLRVMTFRGVRRFLPYLLRRSVFRLILLFVYRRGRATARDLDEYWAPSQFPEFAPAMRDLFHQLDWGVRSPLLLQRLNVPVFYARGNRDMLLSARRARRERAQLHYVRVLDIAGAGHVIAEEACDELAPALIDFLSGVNAKP